MQQDKFLKNLLTRYSLAVCIFGFVGCGQLEDSSSSNLDLQNSHARLSLASAVGVKMTDCADGGVRSITPSSVPADKTTNEIKIEMCITFDISSNASSDFFTNYATGRWGIQIIKSNQTTPIYYREDSGEYLTSATGDEGIATGSGTTRSATMKFVLDMTKNGSKIEDNWIETTNGRAKITFKPYFITSSEGDAAPDSTETVKSNSVTAIEMKTDVGVFRDPLLMRSPQVSDGTIIFGWDAMSDKSSVEYSTGTAVLTGEKSSLGGYVLMVWDHEKCSAAGSWNFVTNPDVSATQQNLSCTYPQDIATGNTCAISTTTCVSEGTTINGESPQNIAIPTSVPSTDGGVVEAGCYKVYRVNGANSTRSVEGLVNGQKYGAFVWPIDGSGHIGRIRSGCVLAKPQKIPLPSDSKDPNASKSKDCFVVTAASGHNSSRAVAYWRIIRDRYLEQTRFKRWYTQNGPHLASWLDAHQKLKPITHAVLALSGWAIVDGQKMISELKAKIEESLNQTLVKISSFVVPVAHADEPKQSETNQKEDTQAKTNVATESQHKDTWSGSSWSNINFNIGVIKTSKDADYYDAYYNKRMPLRVMVSQSFRLFDASGEFGVGYGFSYTSLGGEIPQRSPDKNVDNDPAIVGTGIGFYSLGAYGIAEYRVRIGKTPFLWPRITVGGGYERFREDATKPNDYDDSEEPWSPKGTTYMQPAWFARFSLELALAELGLGDGQALRDGYGANEFSFALYGEYFNDTSTKHISMSGIHMGIGVGLLLP